MRNSNALSDWEGRKWSFEQVDEDLITDNIMLGEGDYFRLKKSASGDLEIDQAQSHMASCWQKCELSITGSGTIEWSDPKLPPFAPEVLQQYLDAAGTIRAQADKGHLTGVVQAASGERRVHLFHVDDAREEQDPLLVLGIDPSSTTGPDGGGVGNGGSH